VPSGLYIAFGRFFAASLLPHSLLPLLWVRSSVGKESKTPVARLSFLLSLRTRFNFHRKKDDIMKSIMILAALCISAPAYAATLHYDEANAPGGDFSNVANISATHIGTMPTEFRSVSGAMSGHCAHQKKGDFIRCSPIPGQITKYDDRDSFLFSLAEGTKISKLSFSATGFGPEGFGLWFDLHLYDPTHATPTSSYTATIPINSSGTMTLPPWTYFHRYTYDGFNTFGISVSGRGGRVMDQAGNYLDSVGDYKFAWHVELETAGRSISTVPLPASAPLLLAGFGGLAALRRRKVARG
jgi:hypothetical protein